MTASGATKAAMVIMQLDNERSARILRTLRESEVQEIMAEIARLETVEPEEAEAVLLEFRDHLRAREYVAHGGIERARELLEQSLGPDRARQILENLQSSLVKLPFEFLRRTDPRQVLSYLQDEHPQTIALVLAHMQAEAGSLVLTSLPEDLQRDVAHRLASMDRTSPEVIAEIESILEPKFSSVVQQADLSTAGGVQTLVDIINRSDRATERLILEGLEAKDADLADEVRSRMFVFEDIVNLDDRSVQLVLRQVEIGNLAIALKGVPTPVVEKITRNLSERATQNLAEEIDILGPVRLKTVEEAQGAIVHVIRALEESGQVILSRSNDEFVV